MGSGSSRSGRALRRRRGPESRPAGPCAAAPEGGTEPRVSATAAAPAEAPGAAAVATEEAAGHDPGPAAPRDGREETLRLLDQLLAESAAWDLGEPTPRRPARPRSRPAAGTGSAESPGRSTGDHPGSSSVSEAPGSSHKRPEGQSAISYDYSEEELMASIEREYCR
ncbi:cystin-1 [Lemur catta]|uniref:cystin-1 n=1 Tax=Lemur catta TaxID=9447 RepID=UPI001E26E21A|nr:cystin-1 [Lemur catta]